MINIVVSQAGLFIFPITFMAFANKIAEFLSSVMCTEELLAEMEIVVNHRHYTVVERIF